MSSQKSQSSQSSQKSQSSHEQIINLIAEQYYGIFLKLYEEQEIGKGRGRNEKNTDSVSFRAPMNESARKLLIKTLIEEQYTVKESMGCMWLNCDCKYPDADCKKTPWLSVIKTSFPTARNQAQAKAKGPEMELYQTIEKRIRDPDVNVLEIVAPKDEVVKMALLAMLSQNNYLVNEITTQCNHRCHNNCNATITDGPGLCEYFCGHECSLDGTNCSSKHLLLISNQTPLVIAEVVEQLVKDINDNKLDIIPIPIPLKIGVMELLLKKLRESECKVEYIYKEGKCLHGKCKGCAFMPYTCHCDQDAEYCRCDGNYCAHVCVLSKCMRSTYFTTTKVKK